MADHPAFAAVLERIEKQEFDPGEIGHYRPLGCCKTPWLP
jgi:hypothetical protein